MSTDTASRTSSKLYNLHLLRAVAALGVVYYHITSEAGLNLRFNIGAHGVDVFFVISGFIISYIAAQSPGHFLARRLIRIVPFYWTATLVLFGIACILPSLLRETQADVVQLVCSLLFIPRETAYAGTVPTLVLGWSLNYEMYFYALFAIALLVSRRWAPVLTLAMIAAVVAGVSLLHTASPSIMFYGRPLVFEFGFGIAAYYVFQWFVARAGAPTHNRGAWVIWLLAVVSLIALGVEEFHQGFGLPRFVAAGIPAFTLVCCALALERIYGFAARQASIYLLGESSYILYLIHPYIVYGCLRGLAKAHVIVPTLLNAPLIILLLAASAIAAVGVHVAFEKPVLEYLRRKCLPDARGAAIERTPAIGALSSEVVG